MSIRKKVSVFRISVIIKVPHGIIFALIVVSVRSALAGVVIRWLLDGDNIIFPEGIKFESVGEIIS